LQRLFSTFAGGWPGLGLLVQRLATGTALLHYGIVHLYSPAARLLAPNITGAVLGLFILLGLWTPVAGTLTAAVELWILLAGGDDACTLIILAVLGGTLAMVGPGAWSIDARLFGRKRISG
jgi:putative oxidoreductase